jgi:hypothetical protein
MDHQQPPAPTLLGSLLSSLSRSRRLEDRIRTLCAQAVDTTDLAKLPGVLEQLKAALHDHVERLRRLAAGYPVPTERRQF